ncbi:MAG: MFS transporter [Alphaproteobacteria bacterium]
MPAAKAAAGTQSDETNWRVVWIAFGAGIIAATHIGKLPPALTDIRTELEAGLVMAGWILSTISTTGFVLGLAAGAIADRVGPRRMLVFGLLMLAAGSLLGALATSAEFMLLSRFLEGVGFTSTTVTGGVMIARATTDADRKWALGVWAAYMPLGFAGMMMVSALGLESLGWRALWGISGAISLVWAIAVLKMTAGWNPGRGRAAAGQSMARNIGLNLRQAGGLLVAACFALYAAQHIGMMSWLPTYMTEVYGSGIVFGAAVPALVLLFNAGGNYTAAWAMGRGAPIWLLLALGAGGMAIAEAGIFWSAMPDALRLALVLFFGIAGGLIPASALAAAPVYAPSPSLVGAMSGVMVMGSNTGQLFGPPLLATAREAAGNWDGTLWVLLGLAVASAACALLSRQFEIRAIDPK